MSRVSIGAVLVILSSAVASTSGCSVIGYTLRCWDGAGLLLGGQVHFPVRCGRVGRSAAKSVCLILALVCVSGCSVVGLGLGTFADRQAERFKRPDSDALREACGRPVCLRLRDGSTATGRLARVEVGPESLLVLHAPPPERIAVESGAEGDSIRVPLRDVVQISAEYNTRTPAFVVLGSMADVVIITAILAHQSTPFHPALH